MQYRHAKLQMCSFSSIYYYDHKLIKSNLSRIFYTNNYRISTFYTVALVFTIDAFQNDKLSKFDLLVVSNYLVILVAYILYLNV